VVNTFYLQYAQTLRPVRPHHSHAGRTDRLSSSYVPITFHPFPHLLLTCIESACGLLSHTRSSRNHLEQLQSLTNNRSFSRLAESALAKDLRCAGRHHFA
jgi:hypothetical protein